MGSRKAKKGMLQTANGALSSRRQVHVGVTVFLSFPPDARPRTKRQPKRGTTGGPTDVPRATTARTRLSATRLRPGAFRKRKRRACGRNVLAFMGSLGATSNGRSPRRQRQDNCHRRRPAQPLAIRDPCPSSLVEQAATVRTYAMSRPCDLTSCMFWRYFVIFELRTEQSNDDPVKVGIFSASPVRNRLVENANLRERFENEP